MIKVMVLLSRLPGVTREEFKAYYETKHAPLIASLIPSLAVYRRNYPDVRDARFPSGMNDVNFDSVTELAFTDRAGFDAFKRITSDPETLKIIRADEANFLDHTKTHWFVMEEHSSDLAKP